MPTIDNVINITITRDEQLVRTADFGSALILAEHDELLSSPASTSEVLRVTPTDFSNVYDSTTKIGQALAAYFGASGDNKPSQAFVGFRNDSEPVGTALDRILGINSTWYAVILSNVDVTDQTALGVWVNNKRRLAAIRTSEASVLGSGTTDIGSVLKATDNRRIFTAYTSQTGNSLYLDSAILGKMLPFTSGTATWEFKNLLGVTADSYNEDQLNNLSEKNVVFYTDFGGVNVIRNSRVAKGDFIDQVLGEDWLRSRLQEGIASLLVSLNKVDYSDKGVGQIRNAIESVLDEGQTNTLIAIDPAPVITTGAVSSVSAANRANRLFPDIDIELYFLQAIHSVRVRVFIRV